MNRKILGVVVATAILVSIHPSEAQQPKKVPRIGFLVTGSASSASTRVEAFRRELRDLG